MKKLINIVVTLLFALGYYYIVFPPINLQSEEFYMFIILICLVYIGCSIFTGAHTVIRDTKGYFQYVKKNAIVPAILIGIAVITMFVGSILSMEIFRAGAYKELLNVETGDFATDITEISADKIPMLDRDSAIILGDRKLGELADMVSQFEVSANYTQINYNGRPVRVTPLRYGDTIKWFVNQREGIPAYIVLDMATQEVDVIRLENGIKYSESEFFNRKISRFVQLNYPTTMFDVPTFEIDEEGTPYWICPKIVKRIGLFGGMDIEGAVLVNAINGKSEYYKDVPNWVDRLYNSDLIVRQYNYYGTYVHGFINSILGQKDVTVTTEGYNYIALNDDVYLYTGITSVGADQSNIGFILSNQRTKETKFYSCAGATEQSAMASARGIVQHLGYTATFPILLNVADQPTYFMALKDAANLVKMYAMVNVEQYQLVATGNNFTDCEQEYIKLLKGKNMVSEEVIQNTVAEGTIVDIRTAVKEGTSYYYLKLDNSENYYVISATQYEPVVILNVGDSVKIEHFGQNSDRIYSVSSISLK